MQQFSLRSWFRLGFVLLALIPALLTGWVMLQRSVLVTEELAKKTLQDAASRAKSDVQTPCNWPTGLWTV